ncbi:MAG: DUF1963 domain-containing protein [Deltaproteobacteria bacterium]|nr:MAG: DUF1963 domain-containing protein [Deltaproteobacteria bacterium]
MRDMLLLHRLPRARWAQARSWFGGLPRLDQPWPRGAAGPLSFAAQLDLAEAAEAFPGTWPLPREGHLAVFLGPTDDRLCAVLHVRTPGEETPIPEDALPVGGLSGEYTPGERVADVPVSWPRWPVGFRGLPALPEDDPEDAAARERQQQRAVDACMARRGSLDPGWIGERLGLALPVWWRTARILADQLERVADARPTPGFFGRLLSGPDVFGAFVAEVREWVDGYDPNDAMSEADVVRLDAYLERVRGEHKAACGYRVTRRRAPLHQLALRAMVRGDEAAWQALPEPVRTEVDTHHLLSEHWHQVLGDPVAIQGNAVVEHAGDLLLLQLVYDELMDWEWGDMGAYQLWISPEDAADGDFSRVEITFECG